MHEVHIAISTSDHETCALILTVHTYLLTLYYACIKCLTQFVLQYKNTLLLCHATGSNYNSGVTKKG